MNSSDKVNLLAAYPYMGSSIVNELMTHANDIRFILDSGAFTAWKAGKTIKLDDYCRFLDSLPFEPWRYFALDVIGDPAESLKNYEIMLKRGYNPVPIFTRGECPSVLDDFYKTSDLVGIGGLVGTPNNKAFVNAIMKVVGDRRVHWLGFAGTDFIKHYRPYMCDSSSWSSGSRFGALMLYNGRGEFVTNRRADFINKPSEDVRRLVKQHGIDYKLLSKKDHWSNKRGASLRTSGYRAWLMYQRDITKYTGTKFFLAITNPDHVEEFMWANDWLKGKT